MKEKSLKSKAVDIKGKEYILVKDRVLYFNEAYERGYIVTELLSDPLDTTVVIKADVYPDAVENNNRHFTGHAQEVIGEGYINKTSAMENAETSAVGRALAMMGIGVLDSIASVDEINKATNRSKVDLKDFDPATEKVTFGKHKGKLWIDLPQFYLDWLLENGQAEAKSKAKKTLKSPNPVDEETEQMQLDDVIGKTVEMSQLELEREFIKTSKKENK